MIGFGKEMVEGKEIRYWLIRNVWGTGWGVNGYGKINQKPYFNEQRGKNVPILEHAYSIRSVTDM